MGDRGMVCALCGAAVSGTVRLRDGALCHGCAGKLRISFPLAFTWVERTTDAGSADERPVWLDPLGSLSVSDLPAALETAEAERDARRTRYGDARAYFEVDDNRLLAEAKEHALFGRVLLGEVRAGDRLTVRRRSGVYAVTVRHVEAPPGGPALGEGCTGVLILTEEAPFIYPGDRLEIE